MTINSRTLFFTEYYYPHWTGLAVSVRYYVKQLKELGHSITVLTTQFDKNLPLSEVVDGVSVVRSPYQVRLSRTHYSFSILADLMGDIGSFDTVIINSPNSNILLAALITKLSGRKLIIWHQGDLILPKKSGNQIVNWILMRVFDVCTIASFAMADRIATFTLDYGRHSRVMKYFTDKTSAYIPPIHLPPAQADTALSRKLEKLKNEHELVGFAGRFVEEKGFDILLQSIPLVLARRPRAHFVFAGRLDMGYENTYEGLKAQIESLSSSLTILGLLPQELLGHFYGALSVFVLSSRSDCFGLTQMDAARAGVPLVCTDIPGARTLVKETGYGEIVKTEDPQSLAEGIVKVLENRASYLDRRGNIGNFFQRYDTPPLA